MKHRTVKYMHGYADQATLESPYALSTSELSDSMLHPSTQLAVVIMQRLTTRGKW